MKDNIENNIFKINEDSKIIFDYIEPDVEESKFYIIENFFSNPEDIVEFLSSMSPSIWKENSKPSYNTIYFDDMVHDIEAPNIIKPVYDLLGNICNQGTEIYNIRSNLFKFKNHQFNNYHEHYWSPHKDYGYTGIVYLNENDDYNGTNVYKSIDLNFEITEPEHHQPWIPREKYDVLLSVPPKYNRLFFFNASEYFHGMNIYDDRYTHSEYRTNLVFNMETVGFPY
jgi:hypothetical protein